MRKITKDDIKFAIENFDENGYLISPLESQREGLKNLINSGCIKQVYGKGITYMALGSIATAIASYHLSKLLNTNIIAIQSI